MLSREHAQQQTGLEKPLLPQRALRCRGSRTPGQFIHPSTLHAHTSLRYHVALRRLTVGAEFYEWGAATWTVTAPLTQARTSFHTATTLANSRVLVAGGFVSPGSYRRSAELYDPVAGTWTATGLMNSARRAHTATLLLNGKVLLAGGTSSSGYLSSAELYDPATGP